MSSLSRLVIYFVLVIALPSSLAAQTTGAYMPANSAVYVASQTTLGIWGDTLDLKGSLQMEDTTSIVFYKGRTWRNDPSAQLLGGRIVLNDTSLQAISGGGSYSSGPSFSRLEISNSSGVYMLGSHLRVDSSLVFSKGVLLAGTHDIILGRSATTSQSDSSFASTYEGGGVSKLVGANSSFTFPVGTTYSAIAYNPVRLDLYSNLYNPGSYARITMGDSTHAKKSPRHTKFGEKFWSVQFRNLTVDSANYTAMYNITDVFQDDTSQVVGSVWANGKWNYANSGSISGNRLAITGKLSSDGDIFGQNKILQASVKTILQGAWNGTQMNTTLRTNNLVPLDQPYGATPFNVAAFNYTGTEHRAVLPPNAVDWVLLELRSTATGAAVARSAGIILNDGSIVDGFVDGPVEFSGVTTGNYYVIVKHRNHLGIMSSAPIAFPNASVYDFTTGLAKAYDKFNLGLQMAQVSAGKYGLRAGNAIPDASLKKSGLTSVNDRFRLVLLVGTNLSMLNVYNIGDLNMDGNVRISGLSNVNDAFKVPNVYLGLAYSGINQAF